MTEWKAADGSSYIMGGEKNYGFVRYIRKRHLSLSVAPRGKNPSIFHPFVLAERERLVLDLVIFSGLSVPEVAIQLGITKKVANAARDNAYRKIRCRLIHLQEQKKGSFWDGSVQFVDDAWPISTAQIRAQALSHESMAAYLNSLKMPVACFYIEGGVPVFNGLISAPASASAIAPGPISRET